MTAHFYLLAESFANNSNFQDPEIEDKIMRLAEDVKIMNKYKDSNKIYTNYEDLYPQLFFGEYTVEDFICNPTKLKNAGVDRDVLNALSTIIEKSEATKITSEEVRESLLEWDDDENCHGLIAFHEVEGIKNEKQVIYGIDCWYKFRRFFLGKYPKNINFTMQEFEKYFPKLYFHTENYNSLKDLFPDFIKNIILHLGYLNDIFYTYKNREFTNESEKYKAFTSECNLEEKAASKDSNSAKEKLKYKFKKKNDEIVEIICYPHLRICRSDISGDNKYYQHRIYFHEGFDGVENGCILIGHIGKHRK
jgi:hypothetical protein